VTNPPALFRRVDATHFLPSELTRGPWTPDALHGGPPSALIVHALDADHPEPDKLLARLTVEILRPVPLVELTVTTEVVRGGKRVSLLSASIVAGDMEVVRAQGLRIRQRAMAGVPASVSSAPEVTPESVADRVTVFHPGPEPAFHRHGVEFRTVAGRLDEAGPVTVWARLIAPVVDGAEASPVERVVALADFGNGISWELPMHTYLYINPDLTVHLSRAPVDEWIQMESRTILSEMGSGLAESALSDRMGRIGRSLQSLYVAPR